MNADTIYTHVASRYSASAQAKSNPTYSTTVASAFGYSLEDLSSIPADSNLGLSCGNPLALAHLKPGETVVDLGSGAGFDCFLAAKKVGEMGKVVGVDMNKDMLARARRNAEHNSITNVSFVGAKITAIPLPSAAADVVISNCVINLVPAEEKPLVFHEIYRLLKPGGRLAVSDILLKKELTEDLKDDVALYVGCIAGASQKFEYEQWLGEAGFQDIMVIDAGSDLNVYITADTEAPKSGCCGVVPSKTDDHSKSQCGSVKETTNGGRCGDKAPDGGVSQDFKGLKNVDLNDLAGSFKIFAVKSGN